MVPAQSSAVSKPRIIIPGAAGLVGQNLILRLKERGMDDILAIDKHPDNVPLLRELHPDIEIIEADLADPGPWQDRFAGGDVVVMLQAHIGSSRSEPFVRNNITSTENVLSAISHQGVPYLVHLSSSVVCSVANDDYTNTKRRQEEMVVASGVDACILRPTLMFGWFDRKHLGWISRFMQRAPIIPLVGRGRVLRQPMYVGDLCNIILSCITGERHTGKTFNITGREELYYADIVRAIRDVQGLRTLTVPVPYSIFWLLLRIYALFDRDPPFTTDQLEALVAGDEFELIPWWDIFEVPSTPFQEAIRETYCDSRYSHYVLHF